MTKENEIRRQMTAHSKLPYQAAAMGFEIFVLQKVKREPVERDLVPEFLDALRRWELEDVLENQIAYALRLASDNEALIYEEMHKLFSLLDEIHALQQIGLSLAAETLETLTHAVRTRFQKQASLAVSVATDRVDDWCQGLWWYADILG